MKVDLSLAAGGLVALLFITTPVSAGAWPYCSEPQAPSRISRPEKPTPPDRPFCAAARNCSQYDIDRYNDEVRTYNAALEAYQNDVDAYVRKLKTYVDEALEYATCEVKSLRD